MRDDDFAFLRQLSSNQLGTLIKLKIITTLPVYHGLFSSFFRTRQKYLAAELSQITEISGIVVSVPCSFEALIEKQLRLAANF